MRTLIALALLTFAAPADALDAEAATPYRWRVLVRVDNHPLATPGYRAQISRDVSAALTPLIDGVGTVRVVELDRAPEDAFAQLVKKVGFAAFDDPQARGITGDKTHLLAVTLDARGVRLRCRGLDGSTGLATPAERQTQVRDFAGAGRAAGLLLGREFGPVGTLDLADPAAERVQVRFQGGALPGFDPLVRAGDVFALALIREGQTGPIGQARDLTLLRAEADARSGHAECRLLSAFQMPLRTGRGVLGFRCIKLATATAPLTVKLLDPAGKPPPPGNLIQVRASDIDFLPRSDGRDRLGSDAGVYKTGRPFRGVACVVVSVGTVGEKRYPVAITGPAPVTLTFQPDPKLQQLARAEEAREELRIRLLEARAAHTALVGDLAKRLDAGRNDEALARGEQGLAALAAQQGPLADDLKRFTELAGAEHPDVKPFAESIAQLQKDCGHVQERVKGLRAAVASKPDAGRFEKEFRAKDLQARVRLALDRGDVPEAADLMEQLARISGDTRVLETRARLQAEYKARSDAHAQAREAVPGTLKTASSLIEFDRGLVKLKAATQTIAAADDRYGLRAVAAAVEASYPRLKEILDRIDPNTDRGRRDIQELKRVTDEFRALQLSAQGQAAAIEAGGKP